MKPTQRSPSFGWFERAMAAIFFIVLVTIGNSYFNAPRKPPGTFEALQSVKPGFGQANYDAALTSVDSRVDLARERLNRDAAQWLNQETYARALLSRFRLTGSYDDLVSARKSLQIAFENAPPGSGPLLTNAAFSMTTHELAQVQDSLAQLARQPVPPSADEQSEAKALAGDAAFYTGNYKQALGYYQDAAKIDDGIGLAFRKGRYYQKTDQPDLAISQYVQAAKMQKNPTPQLLSSVYLQIGVVELERGNWGEADRFFKKADQSFPGHWLTQAHLAQMMAVTGKYDQARSAYEAIIARTDSPEVMDALAALYRTMGKIPESRALSDRASAAWGLRLKQMPNAALGHAVDHELVFGQAASALAMAQRNYSSRPHGDTAVVLGWALIAANQPQKARAILEDVNKSAWGGAQQHAALAEAYGILGDRAKSDAQRQQAEKINPKIFDAAAPMIWFGHH